MSRIQVPPSGDEIELTLLGPGYGESIVAHLGGGAWVVIDSCTDSKGVPLPLMYFREIGIDPAQAVALVAVTHWHDDHIKGISEILESCSQAEFSCSIAFCREEFLTLVGISETNHFSSVGSGLYELHKVFSYLNKNNRTPTFAIANSVVLKRNSSTIWSLSPDSSIVHDFLHSIAELVPDEGEKKDRTRKLTPNKSAVVFRIDCGAVNLLLGADLEKEGWLTILSNTARPSGKSSIFKVPHHGAKSAHEPQIWQDMLESQPIAIITPWRRGGGVLPTNQDAERILALTSEAWITNRDPLMRFTSKHSNRTIARNQRESGIKTRPLRSDTGIVRLRRHINLGNGWTVEKFGRADHLSQYRV